MRPRNRVRRQERMTKPDTFKPIAAFLFACLCIVVLGVRGSQSTDAKSGFVAPSKQAPGPVATPSRTREVLTKKLGWQGTTLVFENGGPDAVYKLIGRPDNTQKVGGDSFWYYNCSDGMLQIEVEVYDSGAVIISEINEY